MRDDLMRTQDLLHDDCMRCCRFSHVDGFDLIDKTRGRRDGAMQAASLFFCL